MSNIKYFLLTGEPGVGKTTLTKKLNAILTEKGVLTSGFYTEEVRTNRKREGFDVVALNGQRGRLARDSTTSTGSFTGRVGNYGVLVQEFENIALPSLEQPENSQTHLLIIDEIGKMEFLSNSFKTRIREIFGPTSKGFVLATIPLRKSDTLIESIRNHTQAKLWKVTKQNRDSLLEDVLKELKSRFNLA